MKSRQAIRNRRPGFLILLVFAVIVLIALSSYTFSFLMIREQEASYVSGSNLQAKLAAESISELVKARAAAGWGIGQKSFNDQIVLQRIDFQHDGPLQNRMNAQTFATCFSAINTSDGLINASGVSDEHARLNLYRFLDYGDAEMLAYAFENMSVDQASEILDWVDLDDSRFDRPANSETQWYESNGMVPPPSGSVRCISELANAAGITRTDLFGEDVNNNGILDPNENDGDLSFPPDNQNGVLEFGWAEHLTLQSADLNVDEFGQDRIFLNDPNVLQLYGKVVSEFGADAGRYVLAKRLYGNARIDPEQEIAITNEAPNILGIRTDDPCASHVNEFAFPNVMSLVADKVRVIQNPGVVSEIKSPFTPLPEVIDAMLERMTVLDSVNGQPATFLGRVNVNRATPSVLLSLPFITKSQAAAIYAARLQLSPAAGNYGWLVSSNAISLEELGILETYICSYGHTFRYRAIGMNSDRGSAHVIKGTIRTLPNATFHLSYASDWTNRSGLELQSLLGNARK